MSDDLPTCETCDYFFGHGEVEPHRHDDEGLCEAQVEHNPNGTVTEDFGCILHSDLEGNE